MTFYMDNYCNYIHYGLSFNQQMCKLSKIITKIVFVDKLSHFRPNALNIYRANEGMPVGIAMPPAN